MYETKPYIQRPDDFHQCFEYVTHDTRCTETDITPAPSESKMVLTLHKM